MAVNPGRLVIYAAGALALACHNNPSITSTVGGSGGNPVSGTGGTSGSGGSSVPQPNFGFGVPDGGGAPAGTGGAPAPMGMYTGGVTRPCAGLECQQSTCLMGACKQKTCTGAARTTVSGRVYDPAGKVPLYNVVLYVPNAPLDPIATGPSCDRCDSPVSGKPIASALTDTKGDFLLDNVPVGTGVPLVIQIGKWRRQVTLPEVKACADNHVDDANLLRLPRTQKEGNIPRIALTTGGFDRLECLIRKIGIDDSEFTTPTGPGRVNLYGGRGGAFLSPATTAYAPALNGGAAFPAATGFWGDPANLNKYDMVVLSCEGNWYPDDKSPAARQGLVDYANKGGRIFASHWHGVWIQFGPPPWSTVANFVPASPIGTMDQLPDLPDGFETDIDTSFPKGASMADWLVNVQASTTRGKLPLTQGKHSVLAVDPNVAQSWIQSSAIPLDFQNMNAKGVQYFTFNAPVGTAAANQCGRTVLTDIHVSAQDMEGPPFPTGCVTTELSPQEKALEFMLFDLSSCLQPDRDVPKPPIIP
jgi:hypothetical protein